MAKIEKKIECLGACYGKPAVMESLITYADGSIVSKTLLDKPAGTITLFAFDRGQRLSEHTAPFDAVVQVVDGEGVITIDGNGHAVAAGEIIIMPANIRHAVTAEKRFKMLLTMIRA
ncbi:MAG: cupin domain-containing protein [Planctomycetales bacterium]|nr:cupin domain-containing protein [Planctomycetales bacterium]